MRRASRGAPRPRAWRSWRCWRGAGPPTRAPPGRGGTTPPTPPAPGGPPTAHRPAPARAPLPGGPTNVPARRRGTPDAPVGAAGELLDALDRKSFPRIGRGRIGDRHFLFHCGVGFDAAVVEAVERRAAFKRYAAH